MTRECLTKHLLVRTKPIAHFGRVRLQAGCDFPAFDFQDDREIAELLGIPPAMFGQFRAWSESIVKAFSITPDPAGSASDTSAMAALDQHAAAASTGRFSQA